ncbi:MAG: aldolase/citrate lyase family protein [Caldilineaceae bacterium]
MRKSKMLEKFRSGRFARVCSMGHFLPFYIRYAAHFQFDGIWLDLEHRCMSDREVQAILAMCQAADIDCMVRPPTLERTKLYRYLEDGASGFLVPLVSTPELAYDLVQAAKFPPIGNRGMDGAGVDADFGIAAWGPGMDFAGDANRETFILPQIETLEAVANAEAIAAIEGIDGLFLGPADLNLRIAAAPAGQKITFEQAVETVAAACRKHNKVWGIAVGSLEQLKQYRALGAQVVPWGGDFALMKVLDQCRQDLDEAGV